MDEIIKSNLKNYNYDSVEDRKNKEGEFKKI